MRFDAARRAAFVQDLLAVLGSHPAELLPFDEVRERLRLKRSVERGVEDVPLERIVGTVGRERDFNREFLPREESLRQRWEDVRNLAEGAAGFPPVELYKVGEAYFVVDGHHRISVARALGSPSIEARVREFLTPVPLPAESSLEDVLSKDGLADFLEATGLTPSENDELRVTVPGGYERMLDHMAVHRYYLGLGLGRDISWEEAVRSWYETLYRPLVSTIRRGQVLEEFPGRTEADLYLFTIDHLHNLRKRYGDRLAPDRAVRHFALQQKLRRKARSRLRRLFGRRRDPDVSEEPSAVSRSGLPVPGASGPARG